MTGKCPNCNTAIEQDHATIPSSGLMTKCPACNAKIQLVRESFAKMAYYRRENKSCATCGNQLGHSLHCPSCNAVYPDFFIAADPAAIRRQARESRKKARFTSFQDLNFSLPSFKSNAASKKSSSYTPQRVTTKTPARDTAKSSSTRIPVLIILFIVIIAITGGGYTAYARHKVEKAYTESYFKALNGIKTGQELATKLSSKLAADWKAAQDSGRPYAPKIAQDEEIYIKNIKSEVDKFVHQLKPPTERFEKANEKLIALNNQFAQSHTLAVAPPNSLAALTDASSKSGEQFKKTSQDLKASLDEEMQTELKIAKQTYKSLKDF
jgi:predicted Zn finger-like uncharacterized protein